MSSGRATYYEHPGRTASGEPYNPNGLTAAHHSLPFGTRVTVVNKTNGRAVVVRITDRTNQKTNARRPYVIDLSRRSAHAIGISSVGMVALYQAD
nr:septal ring lytic transglycosylase RlpA family protein [Methylobacterium brachythecii]